MPTPTNYWKFNNSLSDYYSSFNLSAGSGNSYDSSGKLNQAILWDGSGSYAAGSTAGYLVTTTGWTICGWIRKRSSGGAPGILLNNGYNDSFGPGVSLKIGYNSGTSKFQLSDPITGNFSPTDFGPTVTTGTWYFFYVRCDLNDAIPRFYAAINMGTETQTSADSGANGWNELFIYDSIDDLRLYNTKLLTTDLSAIYNGGSPSEIGGSTQQSAFSNSITRILKTPSSINTTSLRKTITANNIIHYYKFNLNLLDSVGILHLTSATTASYRSGIANQALASAAFNTANTNVIIPAGDWTICFWFDPTLETYAVGYKQYYLLKIGNYNNVNELWVGWNKGPTAYVYEQTSGFGDGGNSLEASSIPLATWYFVAIRCTAGVISVTINGASILNVDSAYTKNIFNVDLYNLVVDNCVDDLRIFSSSLSNTDLNTIYNNGYPKEIGFSNITPYKTFLTNTNLRFASVLNRTNQRLIAKKTLTQNINALKYKPITTSVVSRISGTVTKTAKTNLASYALWYQRQQFSSSNASSNFGSSVSISQNGLYAVVGEPNTANGQVSVYARANSNQSWTIMQVLLASDGASGDRFGYNVYISKDANYIYVGAPQANSAAGAVYVFKLGALSYSQTQKIAAPTYAGQFGYAIAASNTGTYLTIGAPTSTYPANPTNSGATYYYSLSGGTYSLTQSIVPSDSGSQSGSALAMTGDGATLLIGAPYRNISGKSLQVGTCRVYTLSAGSYNLSATLYDATESQYHYEGIAVACDLNANTIITGGTGTTADFPGGAIHIYKYNGSTWALNAVINGSTVSSNDFKFGGSIALSPDAVQLAVGAKAKSTYGTTVIYKYYAGSYNKVQDLIGYDTSGTDAFGSSVAMSKDGSQPVTLGVGAPGRTYGTVYFYSLATVQLSILTNAKLSSVRAIFTNAVAIKVNSKINTVNARLTSVISRTNSVNSLRRIASTLTQKTNSLLKALITNLIKTNAYIKASQNAIQRTTAYLKATQTKSQSAVAQFKRSSSLTNTTLSYAKAASSKAQLLNSLLKASTTKTFIAQALLRSTNTKTQLFNSLLRSSNQKTLKSQSILKSTNTKQQLLNSLVRLTALKTNNTTSILRIQNSKSQLINVSIKATSTKTAIATSLLRQTNTKLSYSNTFLKTTVTKTIKVNSLFLLSNNKITNASSRLIKLLTKTQIASGLLKRNYALAVTSNTFIRLSSSKTVNTVSRLYLFNSRTLTSNSTLKSATTKTQVINSRLSGQKSIATNAKLLLSSSRISITRSLLRALISKTHTVNNLLLKVNTKSINANALLRLQNAKSQTLNAYVKQTNSKQLSTATLVRSSYTKTIVSRSLLKSLFQKTLKTNSLLRATFTKTQNINVQTTAKNIYSQTLDSLKRASSTKTNRSNILVYTILSKTIKTNSLFKKTYQLAITTSMSLVKLLSKTLSTNSLKFATLNRLNYTSILTKASYTINLKLDALLRSARVLVHNTNMLARALKALTIKTNGLLRKAFSVASTLNSLIRQSSIKFISTDVFRIKAFPKTFNTNSLRIGLFSRINFASSLLRFTYNRSSNVRSLLRLAGSKSFSTNNLRVRLFTRSHNAGTLLLKSSNLSHSLDSYKLVSARFNFADSKLVIYGESHVSHSLLYQESYPVFFTDSFAYAARDYNQNIGSLLYKLSVGASESAFNKPQSESNGSFFAVEADDRLKKVIRYNRKTLVKSGWGSRDIRPNDTIECTTPVCDFNVNSVTEANAPVIVAEAAFRVGVMPVIKEGKLQVKPNVMASSSSGPIYSKRSSAPADTIMPANLENVTPVMIVRDAGVVGVAPYQEAVKTVGKPRVRNNGNRFVTLPKKSLK